MLIRHPLFLVALTLGLWVTALWPARAFAQEPPPVGKPPPIVVSTNSPVRLLVDGLEVEKTPAIVAPGSQVCIPSSLYYASEAERWLFQGWSHGPKTECVTLTQPGVYKALYKHEVVLHIRANVAGLLRSRWVLHGVPTPVEVPEVVPESESVRYRFQQWSDGETPFSPKNVIAPLKPTALEVKWVKEYFLKVEAPPGIPMLGSGWYPEGTSLVLQSVDAVSGQSREERLRFASWESVGLPGLVISDPKKAINTIKVDAPYTLRANYERQFLVLARSPMGTLKRDWIKEGDEVVLEAPPVQETIPKEERLVFKRWEGQEGLFSAKISGLVDRPIELRAVYDRQFMVTVNAPYTAAGGGWYKEGSTATVGVPEQVPWRLIFRRSFAGFPGYGRGEPTLQVLVREPLNITALYTTDFDLRAVSFLSGLGLVIALLVLANRWLLLRFRRRGAEERHPVERN